MTKFERAIAELKKLPPEGQEAWASMILDQLEDQASYGLTDAQVDDLRRRLAEENPEEMSLEEFEVFVGRLTA
jgi:hypothetical protein